MREGLAVRFLLTLLWCVSIACSGAVELATPLVLAVQSDMDTALHATAVRSTVRLLVERFGEGRIQVKRLTPRQLAKELESGKLDLVLSTSEFFSRVNISKNVLSPVASLWPVRSTSPSEVEGSVYIVRSSDTAIQTVDDMKRTSFALTSAESFSGWLIAQRDILKRGYDPSLFFEKVTFYGEDPLKVFEALENRHARVAVLPNCLFESLTRRGLVDAGKYRLIGASQSGMQRCAHSTELYPSLYLSMTAKVGQEKLRTVLDVIRMPTVFTMDFRWAMPASDRLVHDLLFDLKIGPYSSLSYWTFDRFVHEYSAAVASVLVVLLMILVYTTLVSYVVRVRTVQLRQALADRERIEREANASRDRISSLERAGVVGQMSTMIAHELKQPIGAITNFANGMLRRAKRGEIDPQVLINILEEIVSQGSRASEIVNRVRSYAKHQTPHLKTADLSVAVERAVDNFKRSRRSTAEVLTDMKPYLWAEIDDWEIELAVLNLLKNAADSVKDVAKPEIRLHVFKHDEYWRIEVSDNGPATTQEAVDQFMAFFMTTKESGLGLGLSIVSTIAERHKGHLLGRANPSRGVTLSLDVPNSDIDKEDV